MFDLDDLLNSDVQSLDGRNEYLGVAENVKSGQHNEMEITGNAYNIRFHDGIATIECLWDDDSSQINIDLDSFILKLSNWEPHGSGKH